MSKQTAPRKGLSKTLRRFYGIGDFGFNLMSSVESYYFNYFLTDLARLSSPTVTFITTIITAIDACLSWIYGAILNSIKPMKWGRYRSWLIMAPWIVPFLYACQFIRVGNEVVAATVIILGAISSHVVWNFPYVANVSMIAVAGKTPDERSSLASIRGAWSNLSKVAFSYVCPLVAAFFAGIVGETNQYGATAFVLGCVFVAFYYAHFKMFEGYEVVETNPAPTKEKTVKKKEGSLIKSLLENPPLIALLFADLAKFLFNFVCAGTAIYYFTYIALNKDLNPTYILISNILCVVGSYSAKVLAAKFSARSTIIVSFIAMAAVLLVAFFGFQNIWLVILLMSLAQMGYGIAYSLTPALYADTIIYSEWKTGKNATGWISGLQNVPLKLGVLARGIVINACLAMAAFNPDTVDLANVSPELQRAICMAFMMVPAVILVIAALVMIFGFRLTKEKVVQYQQEIEARKN